MRLLGRPRLREISAYGPSEAKARVSEITGEGRYVSAWRPFRLWADHQPGRSSPADESAPGRSSGLPSSHVTPNVSMADCPSDISFGCADNFLAVNQVTQPRPPVIAGAIMVSVETIRFFSAAIVRQRPRFRLSGPAAWVPVELPPAARTPPHLDCLAAPGDHFRPRARMRHVL